MNKLLWSAALIISSQAFAASEHPLRTLSLDSGYLLNSSRAFWTFGKEVDGAVSTGFDAIDSTFVGDFMLGRVALGGAFYLAWNHFEYGYFVANHEMGHGAHFHSVKGAPVYRWQDGAAQNNIFSFWASGFTQYNNGAQTLSSYSLGYAPENIDLMIVAGGMNNSNEYAEFVEDQITYGGGGHLVQYMGYVRGKLDASEYVDRTDGGLSGDVAEVLSYYSGLGYSISASDLKTGSLVSRWASSTHWAFVWGALQYTFKGEPDVKPFFLGPLKLPDVSHYSTTRGVSYKVRSGLRTSTSFLPLSLEYVYKGDATIEASLGYRASGTGQGPSRFGLEFSANSKGGLGLKGDLTFGLSQSLLLSVGSSFYTHNSLVGERRIAQYLSGGGSGFEAWSRVAFHY